MQNSNLFTANVILEKVINQVDGSVDPAIQRHVANVTFNQEAATKTSLPLVLQNLSPGYSFQKVSASTYPYNENTPPACANRVTSMPPDYMKKSMKTFMDNMNKLFKAQERVLCNLTNDKNGGGRNGDGGGGGRVRTGYCHQVKTTKYCWTHGACAHTSRACRAKAEGHQDTATFTNKMSGSTQFCHRTPE